jgi:hypothetical protein
MRSTLQAGLIVLALLFISGCAAKQKATVVFNPATTIRSDVTYAILPLKNSILAKDKLIYPEAETFVANALESALMGTGYSIVSEGKEDVSISGSVTTFHKGTFLDGYTTVSFSLKAVDKKTGAIIWRADHAKETQFDYDYNPVLLAREAVQELVKELTDSLKMH